MRFMTADSLLERVVHARLALEREQWVVVAASQPNAKEESKQKAVLDPQIDELCTNDVNGEQFIREHGVPPPTNQMLVAGKAGVRCSKVLEYLPVSGEYRVTGVDNRVMQVPVEAVYPVLNNAPDPLLLAENLLKRHAEEAERLKAAAEAQAACDSCYLDLEEGLHVEMRDCVAKTAKIKRYDRWTCTYVLEWRGVPGPAVNVRAVFRDVPDPSGAVPRVLERHARAMRLVEVATDVAPLAANAIYDLPIGSAVEVEEDGGCARFVVTKYLKDEGAYIAFKWIDGEAPLVKATLVDCKRVKPVFWLSEDPEAAVAEAKARDVAERKRLKLCEEAEKSGMAFCLGFKEGTVVKIIDDAVTHNIFCVQNFIPEEYSYTVAPIVGGDPKLGSEWMRLQSANRVRPHFLSAMLPLEALAEREVEHAAGFARMKTCEAANALTADGGLLALPQLQMVTITGNARRQLKSIYSSFGFIEFYDASRRAYDLRFNQRSFGKMVAPYQNLKCVTAKEVVPVWWHAEDPSAMARAALEQHGKETCRLCHSMRARELCAEARLNLPKGMLVERQHHSVHTVMNYCSLTQVYRLGNYDVAKRMVTSVTCETIPASDVRPYIWMDDDPMLEATRAAEAHEKEAQRMKASEFLQNELPQGLLGLPIGLPVRLVRGVARRNCTVVPRINRRPFEQQGWAKWMQDKVMGVVEPLTVLPGTTAGSIAFITGYGKGIYSLGLLDPVKDGMPPLEPPNDDGLRLLALRDQIRFKARTDGVDPNAIRLILSADDPKLASAYLRRRHHCELTRSDLLKNKLGRAGFLNLPVDAPVTCRGEEAEIEAYLPHIPGYLLRYPYSSSQEEPAVDVQPTLVGSRNPVEVFEEFEKRHQREVERLKLVVQANALGATFPRTDALPIGLIVNVPELSAMRGHRRSQWFGKIVERGPRGCVVVQEVVVGRPPSKESGIQVAASTVVPVFWLSESPFIEARATERRVFSKGHAHDSDNEDAADGAAAAGPLHGAGALLEL
eukprot:NODE_95_length_3713_cov_9.066648.p1 GENE.NODE_95_length_3713_cov_9.066648~~NODE_95_length_3713_cov_9.066648.p1  ORF type:complete len:1010 (+),score=257.01 NODE_95_length_3713_cov_9.066648:349-3378(+)